MPAAYTTVTITDNTTTCTLTDNTNFALTVDGWAPQTPVRRVSTLGGRPYTSLVETIRLNVMGATAAAAFANLQTLMQLIDQADRWNEGESTTPVYVTYQPQGSDLATPLRSLIFGFADSGPAQLPATFNDLLMIYEIEGVELVFVRDGVWYGDEEVITAARSTHPSVGAGTFTGFASHLSPVKVELGPLPERGDIASYDTGFLLVADRTSRLQVVEAETMGLGPAWTTDADAARNPSGTGVLVYTPTVTTETNSALGTVTLAAGRRVGIVAAVRNSHATTTFQVRAEIQGPSERTRSSTRPYHVDTSTTDPRLVFLGVVLCEDTYTGIRLYATASAAAGTLSFDYLALINLDNPTSRVVAIGPIAVTRNIPAPELSYLTVDPRALTHQSPQVRQISEDFPINYAIPDWHRGDDAFLLSLGTTIAALFCGRNAVGGYWTAWDTGTSAIIDADFRFTRRIAYLTPS